MKIKVFFIGQIYADVLVPCGEIEVVIQIIGI